TKLYATLHIGSKWDECPGAIGADLRNGRVGLFQKDGIHAAVQRVGEDRLIVITLIGEKNCVAGGIGGGGKERKLPFRPIVSISSLRNVIGIDPVEGKVVCGLGEMKRADLSETVPLYESPDAAVRWVLRHNRLGHHDVSAARVWDVHRKFGCPVSSGTAIRIACGQVICRITPPFLIPSHYQR